VPGALNRRAIASLRCPGVVAERLAAYAEQVASLLGDGLVGIYLHGSLARGCFHPATSDVDIIVVSEAPCSDTALAQVLLAYRRAAIPLDVTFATRSQIQRNETPAPIDCLVKMGKVFRQSEGSQDFIINRQDTYESGIALVGPRPRDVVKPVPWQTLAKALECLFPVVLPRFKNPVLMVCRICHAFAKHVLCSKTAAGEWALEEFNQRWRPLIQSALRDYAEGVPADAGPDESVRSFEQYCAEYVTRVRTAP